MIIGCATMEAGASATPRRDTSPGPAASATPTTGNPHPTSTTSPNPCPAATSDDDEADEVARPSTEDWRNSYVHGTRTTPTTSTTATTTASAGRLPNDDPPPF